MKGIFGKTCLVQDLAPEIFVFLVPFVVKALSTRDVLF
jgi:hypothetical protein